MKYIIIDWLSNVCFGSDLKDLKTFEDADEWLDEALRLEYGHSCFDEECICESMGHECDSLEKLREDYSIEEYDEILDRIMCVGVRYVLKKNYFKVSE